MIKILPNGAQQQIISYEDLSEDLPPRLDHVPKSASFWRTIGATVAPFTIPEEILQPYERLRSQLGPGGWATPTPYLHYRELRELCLYEPLRALAAQLVGEEVGLHLNLTGWVSTERDFHSDSYLSPPGVADWYIAAWIALEDIAPESGPFEFIPGSHLWPVLTQRKLFDFLTPEQRADPAWPGFTQNVVARACIEEALVREAKIVQHLPKRGEVLFWHSNLVHRGGRPKMRGMQRRACIAHYSGVNHRPDMTFETDPFTGGKLARFAHVLPEGCPGATV